jgi:uncharacterized SAM-binding protein YcdF (DUF218 family)
MAIGSMSLLLLLSIPAVAHLLVYPLEHFAPALAPPYNTGAQAIVVLAAGRIPDAPEYDETDVPDYIALARLRYAARLHHETGLPILVSGGGLGEPLAIGMARALQNEFKVPITWIEARSSNTAENARFSANILRHAGVNRVLLVTDAMHMPRAAMAFARNAIDVVPAPTVFFGAQQLRAAQFIPGVEALRRSHYAIYEWAGLIWYRMQYKEPARTPTMTN